MTEAAKGRTGVIGCCRSPSSSGIRHVLRQQAKRRCQEGKQGGSGNRGEAKEWAQDTPRARADAIQHPVLQTVELHHIVNHAQKHVMLHFYSSTAAERVHSIPHIEIGLSGNTTFPPDTTVATKYSIHTGLCRHGSASNEVTVDTVYSIFFTAAGQSFEGADEETMSVRAFPLKPQPQPLICRYSHCSSVHLWNSQQGDKLRLQLGGGALRGPPMLDSTPATGGTGEGCEGQEEGDSVKAPQQPHPGRLRSPCPKQTGRALPSMPLRPSGMPLLFKETCGPTAVDSSRSCRSRPYHQQGAAVAEQ
ncbi:hypothetical protein ABBQ38_011163 [Trebouxia sp. C0009 RCD-2024]